MSRTTIKRVRRDTYGKHPSFLSRASFSAPYNTIPRTTPSTTGHRENELTAKRKESTKMNHTQEIIKRLFLSIAISVAVLIAGTSSAAAAVTRCDGDLRAGTYDTVLVPKGKECSVVGDVIVEQNVILQEGASLFAHSAFTVNGNLQGDGVKIVNLQQILMITIHGNVSIT